MSYLYVLSHGARLRKRGESLLVELEGEVVDEIEVRRLDAAVVLASVQFSTQVLAGLLEHGVSLSVMTQSGKLLGRLCAPLGKNSLLRKTQYEKESDEAFALTHRRTILGAKMENQRQSLLRWRMDNPEIEPLGDAAEELARLIVRLPDTAGLDSMLGHEGLAARHYFRAFAHMFKAQGVEFTARVSHPSPDPVNAALSFGYVLLSTILHSALEAAGFDPFVGFLHEESYGRPSLALDLLEPFRAPIVDRFVVRLFNLAMLKPTDFQPHEDGGVHMRSDASQQLSVPTASRFRNTNDEPAPERRSPAVRVLRQTPRDSTLREAVLEQAEKRLKETEAKKAKRMAKKKAEDVVESLVRQMVGDEVKVEFVEGEGER